MRHGKSAPDVPRSTRPRAIYATPDGAPMGRVLDLVAAVAWKGAKYSTISADKIRQPMLGYSTITEGGVRYFVREDVEAWLVVSDETRADYVRSLLGRGDPMLNAHIMDCLRVADERGRLSADLRPILTELATWGVA